MRAVFKDDDLDVFYEWLQTVFQYCGTTRRNALLVRVEDLAEAYPVDVEYGFVVDGLHACKEAGLVGFGVFQLDGAAWCACWPNS